MEDVNSHTDWRLCFDITHVQSDIAYTPWATSVLLRILCLHADLLPVAVRSVRQVCQSSASSDVVIWQAASAASPAPATQNSTSNTSNSIGAKGEVPRTQALSLHRWNCAAVPFFWYQFWFDWVWYSILPISMHNINRYCISFCFSIYGGHHLENVYGWQSRNHKFSPVDCLQCKATVPHQWIKMHINPLEMGRWSNFQLHNLQLSYRLSQVISGDLSLFSDILRSVLRIFVSRGSKRKSSHITGRSCPWKSTSGAPGGQL